MNHIIRSSSHFAALMTAFLANIFLNIEGTNVKKTRRKNQPSCFLFHVLLFHKLFQSIFLRFLVIF